MNYKILTSFFIFLSFSFSVFAAGDASITVHFNDIKLANNPMTLTVIRDYIQGRVGGKDQIATSDRNGVYRFHISDMDKPVFFMLEVAWNCTLKNYITAGDHINIEYSGDGSKGIRIRDLKFNGKGGGRLIAAAKYASAGKSGFEHISAFRKFDKLVLDSLITAVESSYHNRMEFYKPDKHQLSTELYKIIQCDNFSLAGRTALEYFGYHRKKFVTDQNLTYLQAQLDRLQPEADDHIRSQSTSYIEYRYDLALKKVALRNAEKEDRPLLICEELIAQDRGAVLEKSLMHFLVESEAVTNSRNPDEVYSKALEYINNSAYRKYLMEIAGSRKKGAAAYNFSLPDTTGKIVRLSDFRNKVVIIDCWFTGCSSCSGMAKRVEREVLPSFIDNPNVVFISICADKSKTMWMGSVRSGMYTNPGSVNLYTEGMGQGHPFMKNYNFQGFPRFMLIGKDGSIVSSNMPRASDAMIALIKQALKI